VGYIYLLEIRESSASSGTCVWANVSRAGTNEGSKGASGAQTRVSSCRVNISVLLQVLDRFN
jgi:hypothetical protein